MGAVPTSTLPAAKKATRATARQWAEYLGLVIAGAAVRMLPHRALLAMSVPLGSLVYCLDAKGRQVCLQNLTAAFGDEMSDLRKRHVAEASYQTFARTMLELFWSPRLTRAKAARIFKTEGLNIKAGSAVYVTTHSSNFEWLGQNVPFFREPGVTVAQRLKNPLLANYFSKLRASTGHMVIPQERAISRMLKHLKNGGYFCAVIDLNLDPSEASVIIDQFSGLKTCVTQIHAALALHTGAAIVPAECRPLPDGTYRMIYHPALVYGPEATPAEIAQACWDVLEPGIRQNPECWLWSYKHWRYRPSHGASKEYPPYSNTAGRFDAALSEVPI